VTRDHESSLNRVSQDLGVGLPTVSYPRVDAFTRATRYGNLLQIGAQGPTLPNGGFVRGSVGSTIGLDEARVRLNKS